MVSLDEPAPDFTADTTRGEISLSSLRGKWLVLFAYPADFTPICEADLICFAERKSEFDLMDVQFLGWSVDSVETHMKWIDDIRKRNGVIIDYPLIADEDRKLAERYGILHKARRITYRGLFVIDPEGILRFAATYPLEVGRNTDEVHRIIKVLKRAKELSQLKELDRARELSKYNK
jgi:peroxiredoxin (alkyl hydroperoxide reductase subunit C)